MCQVMSTVLLLLQQPQGADGCQPPLKGLREALGASGLKRLGAIPPTLPKVAPSYQFRPLKKRGGGGATVRSDMRREYVGLHLQSTPLYHATVRGGKCFSTGSSRQFNLSSRYPDVVCSMLSRTLQPWPICHTIAWSDPWSREEQTTARLEAPKPHLHP